MAEIALGGAMSGTGLEMSVVDYVPCYRTEAGNGCAMGRRVARLADVPQ